MLVVTEEQKTAIATLCEPVLARAAELKQYLADTAAKREAEARARAAAIQTRRIPVSDVERETWAAIRLRPDVAPLLLEGWRLVSVEAENGKRVAILERPRVAGAVFEL